MIARFQVIVRDAMNVVTSAWMAMLDEPVKTAGVFSAQRATNVGDRERQKVEEERADDEERRRGSEDQVAP